ncbi:YqiA/YcfP family alpha/beta fold hydrolase [uncultured Paludibaculum sp.]|uniref:YqiA/YcfP family alpha/beta fold hydrolase n=1 Tax=uncultured Paludibaculum sp. TaxID=1765020 RepID=UPI002AAAE9BE|nr:YqiA/YcfP family alpha/beta fold hydrolase [uncultured Paludibaculum sp.]
MNPILYLHGFASSPNSRKAVVFQERFAARGLTLLVPDLAEGGFRNLTITGQLEIIERAAQGRPVSIIGSSMGGYLAALYAARHAEVEKTVLLAPAFGFGRLWSDKLGAEAVENWRGTGVIQTMNYAEGGMAELGWQLMEDALRYEDEPALMQPCLIYHGVHDDVVPVGVSRTFVRTRTCAELREVDSDHELANVVDEIFDGIVLFLGL